LKQAAELPGAAAQKKDFLNIKNTFFLIIFFLKIHNEKFKSSSKIHF
jgi:hypothetical protein